MVAVPALPWSSASANLYWHVAIVIKFFNMFFEVLHFKVLIKSLDGTKSYLNKKKSRKLFHKGNYYQN